MIRTISFVAREGVVWPLILFAATSWRLWLLSRIGLALPLVTEMLIFFLAAYALRVPVILRYASVRKWLAGLFLVIAAATFAMQRSGYPLAATFSVFGYCAFAFGCLFWAGCDEMLEMVEWLSFPTEFGRPPDEIHLIDRRIWTLPGEDGPELCSLYRYRYDQEWDVGLTGPVTFSLIGEGLDGKPVEEIYAAYGAWNSQPGMPKPPD